MSLLQPKSVLVMTALPLERDAVVRLLEKKDEVMAGNGSIYDRCSFEGLEVFVGLSGPSNLNAGPETERALVTLNPEIAIFAGVAGGVKDVSLGDVVVGSKVYSYEPGADGEAFKPRPEIGLPSYPLIQLAHRLSLTGSWRTRIAAGTKREPKVYVGPIAAGEKVVKSSNSAVAQLLKNNFSDSLAVEMEGAAFLRAAYQNRIDALVVRGISDLLDGKADADKSGSQETAANHVAAFVAELLASLSRLPAANSAQSPAPLVVPPPAPSASTILAFEDPVAFWERFRELAPRLYPEGPKDNDVWLKAGGDLSRLNLQESGRTQWGRALRLIERGGGGNIDAKSLLASMLEDFGKNADLRYLYELASQRR